MHRLESFLKTLKNDDKLDIIYYEKNLTQVLI